MTNPNNAIGTNAAFNGRTSPNAFNDVANAYAAGIVCGWACSPKSGMTIQFGGSATVRDVAFAQDNAGNKITINNRSGAPVEVTLGGAPATNNRIDAVVAYVDNPSTGDGSTTDNPTTCGIIAVPGTVAANPTAPDDAAIRAAITTDGATGGTAYYVVLATVLVGTNVTTIGSGVITQGPNIGFWGGFLMDGSVAASKILDGSITNAKMNWATFTGTATTLDSTHHVEYVKVGNMVTLTINYGNVATADGATLGTLPAGCRPYFTLSQRNAYDNQNGEFTINTSGQVKYASNVGGAPYGRATFCFLAGN